LKDGTVTVTWRPGVRLDMPRFKAAVMRWRGAVRYGGATVTVVGSVVEAGGKHPDPGTMALIAAETGQRFRLRQKSNNAPELLPSGELLRVTGRVIRDGKEKENETWLEVDRALPAFPRGHRSGLTR
jgi:hypothetical protein